MEQIASIYVPPVVSQVEAKFSGQRARLIHRLYERDYPYSQVINQLANLVVGISIDFLACTPYLLPRLR